MLPVSLQAALRHLVRDRFFTPVTLFGLATAFAAAIMIGLFVRDEYGFDTRWPDAQRIFLVTAAMKQPGKPLMTALGAPPDIGPRLLSRLGAGSSVARFQTDIHTLRRGAVEMAEPLVWVDPGIFEMFPVPVIAGRLAGALTEPGQVVLSKRAAIKYFGVANPIGEMLELDRRAPLRVTAVIENLPHDTHLSGDVFVSGLTSRSPLAISDNGIGIATSMSFGTYTYLKAPAGESVERIDAALAFLSHNYMGAMAESMGFGLELGLMPIRAAHMAQPTLPGIEHGNPLLLKTLLIIGFLILFAGVVNFVNLMTARAARRATEIAVRKVAGARQGDLVLQLVGETALRAIIALVLALSFVELSLPSFGAFLERELAIHYLRDWALWSTVVCAALLIGACAGLYPALVLAAFRPAIVLKGDSTASAGGQWVRWGLVVVQFTVLIVMLFSTLVVYRQLQFAMNEGLHLEKRDVLVVFTNCRDAFASEVKKLPGVVASACSQSGPALSVATTGDFRAARGGEITLTGTAIDPGFFELYGLRPLAGRFPTEGDIAAQESAPAAGEVVGRVVINETAVRGFGFASNSAALGESLRPAGSSNPNVRTAQVIGVVADFPVGSIREAIPPTAFYLDPGTMQLLSVKLDPQRSEETVRAIDALWGRIDDTRPIQRMLVEDFVNSRFRKELHQSALIGGFAIASLLIACFGLYGLAVSVTERRTKEIGIRKALGASSAAIVRMLLWQFTMPVLVAALIAAPLSYYLMSQWLLGFPTKIGLSAWMIVAASLTAVAAAWLGVGFHSTVVARAKPMNALRHL